MIALKFNNLSFKEKGDSVICTLLNLFYFEIEKNKLKRIADFRIKKGNIIFYNISEKSVKTKFNLLIEEGLNNLKNKLNNKRTIYIHQNSGIPLIGNVAFGIIDRGTSLIEVKPITSCNLRCIYCSVNEDKRVTDFVIEKDYLIQELSKVIKFKDINDIEVHINAQGEPLLYANLIELVKDISSLPKVTTISIDTNATLLTQKFVNKLISAGLTRFNISINALNPKLAKLIADTPYNINRIISICKYITKKADIIITPVLIPGINDEEIPKLIEFAKKFNIKIGIQNFLTYKFGRNPVKSLPWEKFFNKLNIWEKQYNIKLIYTPEDFNIRKCRALPKPFKKGQILKANVVCPGRLKGEKIGVARNRTISILNCYKEGWVKIKVLRTKHNIYLAKLI